MRTRSNGSSSAAALSDARRIEQRGTWTLGTGDALVVPSGEPHRTELPEHADAWRVGFCVPCPPEVGK